MAMQDIREVAFYIAADNRDAAERFTKAVHETCTLLATQPRMGKASQYVNDPSMRFMRVKRHARYLIFYRVEDRRILVTRVLHASRDLVTLLQ